MIWAALAIALVVASLATIAIVMRKRLGTRAGGVVIETTLAPRIEAATALFVRSTTWHPSHASSSPPNAAAIEAALIAGDAARALELAEANLGAPPSPDLSAWLGWTLVANGQPTAALHQLGSDGPGDVLTTYVVARARHLAFEHATGATSAMPPLVTTADLAVVTLAAGRGSSAWLKGVTEVQLSATDVRAAVAEHRQVTAECLELALRVLEAQPGFVEAAYLAARLAVKAGLVEPAQALFTALETRMIGRPDADVFARDLADLRDPAAAVAAAKARPVPAVAKRSRSLRVL